MYVVDRPSVIEVRQWTGSNFAELVAFAPGYGFTQAPNGDLIYAPYVVPVGSWILLNGSILTPEILATLYQESASADDYVLASTLTAQLASIGVTPKAVRRTTVALPALALLGRQTLSITWTTPMPSADYDITLTQTGAAGSIGNVSCGVVSQTAAGCVIGLYAVLALAVGVLSLKVCAIEP